MRSLPCVYYNIILYIIQAVFCIDQENHHNRKDCRSLVRQSDKNVYILISDQNEENVFIYADTSVCRGFYQEQGSSHLRL